MAVAVDLLSGFVECLILVLALDAARRGRSIYWAAVVGIGIVLYARMADGFLAGGIAVGARALPLTGLLTIVGLLLAGLTVAADILFEVVEPPGPEPDPPV